MPLKQALNLYLTTAMTKFFKILPLSLIVFLLTSCGSSRLFTQGETLYTGATVEVAERDDIRYDEEELRALLERYLHPTPNRTILGIFRPRLWLYAQALDTIGFFYPLRAWLANNLGEEPVYYDELLPQNVLQLLDYRLEYHGYYNCVVWYEAKTRGNKTRLIYSITPCKRLITGTVNVPGSRALIWQNVYDNLHKTYLIPGEVFSIHTLEKERQRIVQDMKEEGFYFFNESHVIFIADTTGLYPRANVTMQLSPDIPATAQKKYFISTIYVDIKGRDQQVPSAEPYTYRGITFINNAHSKVSPATIRAAILIEQDSLYRLSQHRSSLNRIMGLPFVGTVDINFTRIGNSDSLECRINIYPKVRKSIQAETGVFARSNQGIGPDAALFFANRNFFNSAGEFRIGVHGEIEYRQREGLGNFSAYKTGFETSLSLPGMILPWRRIYLTGRYIPTTRFNVGVSQFVDFDLYEFVSLGLGISYIWNTSPRMQHKLSPFLLSYSRISEETPFFLEIVERMPFVAASFRNHFIFGPSYNLNYTTPEFFGRLKFNTLLNLELSGIPLVEIIPPSVSSFYKADFDLRAYFETSPNSVFASRLLVGVGVPFGHSLVLPFNELYTAGGAKGIRGFSLYGVGPGAYIPSGDAPSLVERSGDIRVLVSVEQRFPLIGFLKGAAFADAGNVWLFNRDDQRETGEFVFENMYLESAIATGAGLRLDPGFFVFRLDAAFPIKIPGEPNINIQNVNLNSQEWRRANIVYNLAIGYPF